MTALIQLTGVTRTLKGQQEPRTILAGVDLTLDRGQSVAILGRSGSGKSTLLSLIGLFDRPDGGTYQLDGRDITRLSERQAAALRSAEASAMGRVVLMSAATRVPRTRAEPRWFRGPAPSRGSVGPTGPLHLFGHKPTQL